MGTPLAPLITWLDGRSAPTVARWQAAGHDKLVKTRSGWGLRTGQCLPTIAWLRENDPERFVPMPIFAPSTTFSSGG
jgi:sugar (pentulose or hexulose) kinase